MKARNLFLFLVEEESLMIPLRYSEHHKSWNTVPFMLPSTGLAFPRHGEHTNSMRGGTESSRVDPAIKVKRRQ